MQLGFGLCFLHLRNVKGFRWNHKRVYRIYRELELNLRIKPRKRLKRDVPDKLAEPASSNQVWSMDFVRHEAPLKRVEVKGLCPLTVAAVGEKLRAA